MINGISLTSDLPDMEHMLITGKDNPANDPFTCTLMREDLTPAEQATYDAGVALVAGNRWTKIENTTAELNINRITSSAVTEDEGVFDFATMSAADQDTLRDLLALFLAKKD
jgi:hypothetical protein